ncbi:MAG TPA: Crp/Fnr family transcriptional regulator [candidate division Zixibacteria bacterium]|nr:Crp/Fnr family transcriptional regulator [candidate division Zixibacteria bacterium]
MQKTCLDCPHREEGFLKGVGEKACKEFSDGLARYSVAGRGKFIFHQGEPVTGVYLICRGVVKLTTVVPGGEEAIVDLAVPCSIISGVSDGAAASHPCAAVTTGGQVEIGRMGWRQLRLLGERHPALALQLARHFSENLFRLYRRVGMARLPVEQRVALLLEHLVNLLDRAGSEEEVVEIPLSNKELAQAVSTAPETLSRSLRDLRAKGILKVEKRTIRVRRKAMRQYLEKVNGEE